ncbi:Nitrile hydratase subunit alpha [Cupriavidus yeoncheonensis]|uniref:Nitrile hydratase subunit alpha n=1 Tax=Cupriavidus yeoncheonensis TaxID=1462994 RepID=A0A916J0U2_9BURK|nr:nitrile hydratase subunit alpha [Cupriavidus yeoncheonensis]CAG2156068.1 Nitrile hydratase subunit alpha [Cupriavidus yeoncheonensis]
MSNNGDMIRRVDALETLIKAKGLVTEETISDYEHFVDEVWMPANGARLCAKAWTDEAFKQRLLSDGKAAAAELGFVLPEHHGSLVVLENQEKLHNVICCTLCSCTAFTIIGMSPGWYKDLDYRARIVREARTVLSELGLTLPEYVDIRIWDTTADTRYMVLPLRPPHTEGWSEADLASLVTQDALIGVARLEAPYTPANND